MSKLSSGPVVQESGSVFISNISKAVAGVFTLEKELNIETVSGLIDIRVIIRDRHYNNAPAGISLSTVSGSITLRTVILADHQGKPPRDIIVRLNTMSGSIITELHHSSFTSLSSMSGSIRADLFPLSPFTNSNIHIDNVSGSTTLTLHPSPLHPSSPLRSTSTAMRGVSGSARFIFTADWEGKINCRTETGQVIHDWPGLQVRRSGRCLEATKQHGSSVLLVEGSDLFVAVEGKDWRLGNVDVDIGGQERRQTPCYLQMSCTFQ